MARDDDLITRKDLLRRDIATAALVVSLLLLFLFVWVTGIHQRNDIRNNAIQTSMALCTIRHDLQVRVDSSKEFLKRHPNGLDGISRADIEKGIKDSQVTITALSVLHCPPDLERE